MLAVPSARFLPHNRKQVFLIATDLAALGEKGTLIPYSQLREVIHVSTEGKGQVEDMGGVVRTAARQDRGFNPVTRGLASLWTTVGENNPTALRGPVCALIPLMGLCILSII